MKSKKTPSCLTTIRLQKSDLTLSVLSSLYRVHAANFVRTVYLIASRNLLVQVQRKNEKGVAQPSLKKNPAKIFFNQNSPVFHFIHPLIIPIHCPYPGNSFHLRFTAAKMPAPVSSSLDSLFTPTLLLILQNVMIIA